MMKKYKGIHCFWLSLAMLYFCISCGPTKPKTYPDSLLYQDEKSGHVQLICSAGKTSDIQIWELIDKEWNMITQIEFYNEHIPLYDPKSKTLILVTKQSGVWGWTGSEIIQISSESPGLPELGAVFFNPASQRIECWQLKKNALWYLSENRWINDGPVLSDMELPDVRFTFGPVVDIQRGGLFMRYDHFLPNHLGTISNREWNALPAGLPEKVFLRSAVFYPPQSCLVLIGAEKQGSHIKMWELKDNILSQVSVHNSSSNKGLLLDRENAVYAYSDRLCGIVRYGGKTPHPFFNTRNHETWLAKYSKSTKGYVWKRLN